jgi:pyruvate kinase
VDKSFYDEIDLSFGKLDQKKIGQKRTKIVCTMGPASSSPQKLKQLIQSGMNVARLNFSHGDLKDHRQQIRNIRDTATRMGQYIGILQDIQGPKIRLGRIENSEIRLRSHQSIVITTRPVLGNEKLLSCSYRSLHREIKKGHRILIDDGLILLKVESVRGMNIQCRVIFGGLVKNNKGMNFPDTKLLMSCLTPKDKRDLEFGLKEEVDFIALSFVSTGSDIRAVRNWIRKKGYSVPPLIAKIETQQAVFHLEDILAESDGLMVARGDLGVECPLEQVPALQKKIIRSANRAGKVVITATQMLESMIWNPRPTRAEASDVANAVLDGTDAVMLSAETATGKYPTESVHTMSRLILRTEEFGRDDERIQNARLKELQTSVGYAVTAAAVQCSKSLKASAVVAFTQSGKTARLISQFRPKARIFALSPVEKICRRMSLVWGVTPFTCRKMNHTDEMPRLSKTCLSKYGLWKKDAKIVMLSGTPIAQPGSTNLLKVYEIQKSR